MFYVKCHLKYPSYNFSEFDFRKNGTSIDTLKQEYISTIII